MGYRTGYVMVDESDPAWVAFWKAYPKRSSKKDARKAWAELSPDAVLVQKILDALAWQVHQPQWTKDGGQYVPLPASWLRAERWDDEPPKGLQPRAPVGWIEPRMIRSA